MKKKLSIIITTVTFCFAIHLMNYKPEQIFNSDLENLLLTANAQNAEWGNGGDMTWDDIAQMLIDLDADIAGIDTSTPTNEVINFVHAYLDNYDLTGDPAYSWQQDPSGGYHSIQTDDCDGQPNAC